MYIYNGVYIYVMYCYVALYIDPFTRPSSTLPSAVSLLYPSAHPRLQGGRLAVASPEAMPRPKSKA